MTEPTIRDNIRALAAAQQAKAGAPLYPLIVTRPVGRALAAIAQRRGVGA